MFEFLDSIDPAQYIPHIQFENTHYKKILLERNDEYEIFMICWKSGQKTEIHDHPEGGCWMKVIQGELEEIEYSNPTMKSMGIHRLTPGSIGYKQGHILLHSIRAINDSVSLHLYKPPCYKARTYTRDP